MDSICDQFFRMAEDSIDEKGIYPHISIHTLPPGEDGKPVIHVGSFDVDGDELYRLSMRCIFIEGCTEIIFGSDRYAMPGQGTELGDLLAVCHWTRGETPPDLEAREDHGSWRFGVMEYQNDPRIVKAVDWDHPYWTPHLRKEVDSVIGNLVRVSGFRIAVVTGGSDA